MGTVSSSSASSSSSQSAAPRAKRTSKSDPGEQTVQIHSRLRVRAPKPQEDDRKKQKLEKEANILALLEETHARRMVVLAAAASVSARSNP